MFKKLLKLKYNFNPILHNRIILYFFVAISLIDLIYFLSNNDLYSFSILILVGVLTSFFIKNMIVILFVAVIFTHLLKYGHSSFSEGLTGMDNNDTTVDISSDVSGGNNSDDAIIKKDIKELSTIKDFSKKLSDLSVEPEPDHPDALRDELVQNLPEMKATRDKIISHVKNMQPLLDKFQGFVDKFNEYKKSTNL
jgi:hypothetical protein